MKITLNWLKDYVSISGSPEQLAHKLTMVGLEVEKVHPIGGDKVFELEITPNRPDCLNVIGIARETCAILNQSLKIPKIRKFKFPEGKCSVQVVDKQDCPRYIGTCVEDVQIAQTPPWIKERLAALGIRSINNVVDITNFVLIEMGQPLHAFDFDKLIGRKLIIRRAKEGERIVTIDGMERKLDPSILVIADSKRPVAIAGIMGGKDTEVTAGTKNIILESAYFDPIFIRRASRKLGLSTDSSYRFERGVDWDGVLTGADRALSLIVQYAKGTVQRRSDIVEAKKKISHAPVRISIAAVNSYLGADLKIRPCENILEKLGFGVRVQKGFLIATPPSFRNDIREGVDIIEEIARIVGYDKLPQSLPRVKISPMMPSPQREMKQKMRDILLSQGFDEAITYAMVDEKSLNRSKSAECYKSILVKIQNPLSKEQELMRPGILPSFLQVLSNNLNRGQKDLRLFEIGKNYSSQGEEEVLCLMACGTHLTDWRSYRKEINFYDIKGALEKVFKELDFLDVTFKANDCFIFEGGACAEIFLKNTISLGFVGLIAQDILNNWDIKQKNVFIAFIDLEKVYNEKSAVKHFIPIPGYPAVMRDVSLAVKKEVEFQKVKEIACRLGSPVLGAIRLNEEYLGEKIPTGFRGLIFSLTYQLQDRTLREEEVNELHKKICQAFIDNLGAVIR